MIATTARSYYARGCEELSRNELEDARQHFQAAIQLCEAFHEARIGYALSLLRLGDAARAVTSLRFGLHLAQTRQARVALLGALSDALSMSGDAHGAEQVLAEAARCGGPDSAGLHDRLARLRARAGRFDEAFDELLRSARFG